MVYFGSRCAGPVRSWAVGVDGDHGVLNEGLRVRYEGDIIIRCKVIYTQSDLHTIQSLLQKFRLVRCEQYMFCCIQIGFTAITLFTLS